MVGRGPYISQHALVRYRERVEDCPFAIAAERLSSDLIVAAAQFGAPYVRLPGNQRVVLDNGCVVTVLPAGTTPHALCRDRA